MRDANRIQVPFVDLAPQTRMIEDQLFTKWRDLLARNEFVLGDTLLSFETAFADYLEIAHCIGVGNGGDALELSLRVLEIGPGDEVIVPANTFAATAMAVMQTGAVPVAVDVDANSHLIDPRCVKDALTTSTRAVIAVHLFGQMAPMAPLLEMSDRHGFYVIEDAAQAHGASQDGTGVGHFGTLSAFSFYPGKNLGAFGDGGAVVTQDPALARRIRGLRNYGGIRKYEHKELGRNSRLDPLQAAVLSLKLLHLDEWNASRNEIAKAYAEGLGDVEEVRLPISATGNEHVWHLYVPVVSERDDLRAALWAAGIETGIHYPHTIDSIPGVRAADELVTAYDLAAKIVSLPMFPRMTRAQIDCVIENIRRFYK